MTEEKRFDEFPIAEAADVAYGEVDGQPMISLTLHPLVPHPSGRGVVLEVERIWSDRIQKTQDLQCFQRALCQAILVAIAAQLFCGENREV